MEPESTDYKADLVIFTVKNYHLAQALKDVENVVTENTIFLTVLNGVTARDEIKAAYPNNTVLYGTLDRVLEVMKALNADVKAQYSLVKPTIPQ